MARFAHLGVSGGKLDLLAKPPLEVGMMLRDAKREVPLQSERGASFQNRPRDIAGRTLPCFFVHPPYKNGRGYTFWTQQAQIPENAELRFSMGMGPLSPQRSDGVWFQVHVGEVVGDRPLAYTKIFEQATNQHRWMAQVVSLEDYSGKLVRLKFVADCGPRDDATTDHAHWGDVKIVTRGATDAQITETKRTMTWVNDHFFRSSCYWHHIRSNTVTLAVEVEGSEPVTLRRVTAQAHPDAMYRVFEHGLVLANPSRQPYVFELAKLAPGRAYRRIQGSPTQDAETNNGQPVGPTVTLGERDGLFLLRAD
jgi:hypothetical protein